MLPKVSLAIALCAIYWRVDASNSTRNKRDGLGVYPLQLEMGIKDGKSYGGKTLAQLQPRSYWVEVSGGVQNLSNRKLVALPKEVLKGYTWHLPHINPGYSEAFLSIKNPLTATGVWVRYSFVLDDDLLLNFMFAAPFNFNHYDNMLAVGLCMRTSKICRELTAENMYYKTYTFVKKKLFKGLKNTPVNMCFDNYCVSGHMESDHRPIIMITLYPKSYMNLYPEVRRYAIDMDHYTTFIRTIFHV